MATREMFSREGDLMLYVFAHNYSQTLAFTNNNILSPGGYKFFLGTKGVAGIKLNPGDSIIFLPDVSEALRDQVRSLVIGGLRNQLEEK